MLFGCNKQDSSHEALYVPKCRRGTGLDLSISQTLAELMGGAIDFYSNPDTRGCVFWFTVNVAKLPAEKHIVVPGKTPALPVMAPVDPHTALQKIASSKRLLLAEDNITNQKVLLKTLIGLGFESVDTAMDGAQVLRLAKQHSLLYDVILMDISMPLLDGITATMEIWTAGLQIPIIAMTAHALKADKEQYLTKGMDDYISKPVD